MVECNKCHTSFKNEDELKIHENHVDCVQQLKDYNKKYQQEFFRDM